MFGNKPDLWTPRLRGIDRLRATINVMTRLRYCDVRGRIAYHEKGTPGTQKAGLYPWFEVPGRVRHDLRIVCGHWSTLGRFAGMGIYAIDGGCVWGGELIALRGCGRLVNWPRRRVSSRDSRRSSSPVCSQTIPAA